MSAAGRNDLSLVSAVDRGHALSLVGLVRSWSIVRTPLPWHSCWPRSCRSRPGLRTVGRGAAPRRVAGGLHPGAKDVKWGTLAFFMGLFIMVGGPRDDWGAGGRRPDSGRPGRAEPARVHPGPLVGSGAVSGIVDDIPASRAGPVIADIVDNDGSRRMVWWSASASGSSPVTARWLPRSPRDDHRLPLAAILHHRRPNRMIVCRERRGRAGRGQLFGRPARCAWLAIVTA